MSTDEAPLHSRPKRAPSCKTSGWRHASTRNSSRATACASSAAAASTSGARSHATSDYWPRRSAGADAIRHFEHALETNTRVQAPPWIARSLLDLGRALLARGRPGDKQRAIDMLRRAELQAHELGMRSLAKQVTIERTAINTES
jgi:hypothetical protein